MLTMSPTSLILIDARFQKGGRELRVAEPAWSF